MKVRIEKAVYGGPGLARVEGKVVFVPYVLPGELVEAQSATSKKSFSEALLADVLEPSAERTEPPCPYFSRCGGCHYQHARYDAQVAMKVAILRETLERARLGDLPAIEAVSAAPLGYRNRVRLHIDRATSALCYKERNSHRNLAVSLCPIATPSLQYALAIIGEVAQGQRLGESYAEVELFESQDASELLVTLHAGDKTVSATSVTALAELLAARLPTLKGVAVAGQSQPVRKQRARQADSAETNWEQPITRWGAPALTYTVAGEQYRVSSGSFFQTNTLLIDTLASLATEGETGTVAWDLYAGVGLFSKLLARYFGSLTAVEGSPSSSGDLHINLGASAKISTSSVLDFLRRPAGARPDLVLLDPPRSGLGAEVTALLSRIGPPRITYVSCDPATLSRDVAALVNSGYQLRRLHMVDMFPQTYHLETVAQLSLP